MNNAGLPIYGKDRLHKISVVYPTRLFISYFFYLGQIISCDHLASFFSFFQSQFSH